VDVVVQVNGGIAVRHDELQAFAKPRFARGLGEVEDAVLVTTPS
jgi:hypothetical protein